MTEFAKDQWWWNFTAKYLPSAKDFFGSDFDLIRFRIVDDVLYFCIVESKCKPGRTLKGHQRITFKIIDHVLKSVAGSGRKITFRAHGREHSYKAVFAGFFVCNSYACDQDCNRLLDLDGNPATDHYDLLIGKARAAKLDMIFRQRVDNKYIFLVRRFRGYPVDHDTAIILRAIERIICIHREDAQRDARKAQRPEPKWRSGPDSGMFMGLHLLEYELPAIDEGQLWWNGKPSNIREVVSILSFGKITNATPPPIRTEPTIKPVENVDAINTKGQQ